MMKKRLRDFRSRLMLAVLGSVLVLTFGFLWDGGQALSWAAPQQNPQLQTVPPRPTITPGIPPNPPLKPPLPEPPVGPPPHRPPNGGGDDNNDDKPFASEDDQDSAQFMTIIERRSTATAPDEIIIATTTGFEPIRGVPVRSYQAGSPYWLYALILGIVLIVMGLFLINRT